MAQNTEIYRRSTYQHRQPYTEVRETTDLYGGVSKGKDLSRQYTYTVNRDGKYVCPNYPTKVAWPNNEQPWSSERKDAFDLKKGAYDLNNSNNEEKLDRDHLDKVEGEMKSFLQEIDKEQSHNKVIDRTYISLVEAEKESINNTLQQLILEVDTSYDKIIKKAKIGMEMHRSEKSHFSDSSERTKKLQREIQELKQGIAVINKENMKKEDRYIAEINTLKEEKRLLCHEALELSKRLSEEMSTKVSSDETRLENVSIQARPVKISEEYMAFCSNQWLEAKTALDEMCKCAYRHTPEEDRVDFLCSILLTAQEEANNMFQNAQRDVYQILLNPVTKYSHGPRPNLSDDVKIPNQMANALGDLFKSNVSRIDCGPLIKKTEKTVYGQNKSTLSREIQYNSGAVKGAISCYISSAVELAWKMATQRPAMKFETPGVNQTYDPDLQDISWGSDSPSLGSVVHRYVLPVLYHGDAIMTKGKVILKKFKTHYSFGGPKYGEYDC